LNPVVMTRRVQSLACVCAAAVSLVCTSAHATADGEPQDFDARFQATYIWQAKPSFRAAYSGPNSLLPSKEKSYSFSGTAFLGLRAARDTEIYFNPEVVQGVAMSNLTGLGGLPNAELAKVAGGKPTFYRARLFVRQTWGLGGERESVAADDNQLAGARDKRRVVLTAGNFAVGDVFDNNDYAHDARTQFMNLSFMTHGAYDFAADSRGYTWGAALEYFADGWAARAGRFALPEEPNGLSLDFHLARHFGDQAELEKSYRIGGSSGTVKLLAFRDVAVMGAYDDALAYAATIHAQPLLDPVRRPRSKHGWGVNVQQSIGQDLGVFVRAARSDGRSEPYAFAEIDRSASAGTVLAGGRWGRPDDRAGAAMGRNGLSGSHRDYLAAGGLGFFLGDGKINYRPEAIAELYYSAALALGKLEHNALSVGWQKIRNPGFNADRGPVHVVSVRLHTEF
jgi:high affinity Mn2+ porin